MCQVLIIINTADAWIKNAGMGYGLIKQTDKTSPEVSLTIIFFIGLRTFNQVQDKLFFLFGSKGYG